MCCFITALLLAGPRLAILVWWIFSPLYITSIFQTWIWPILGWIFLPWTTLMYMSIAPGGIIGFDWILLGLGIFADMDDLRPDFGPVRVHNLDQPLPPGQVAVVSVPLQRPSPQTGGTGSTLPEAPTRSMRCASLGPEKLTRSASGW